MLASSGVCCHCCAQVVFGWRCPDIHRPLQQRTLRHHPQARGTLFCFLELIFICFSPCNSLLNSALSHCAPTHPRGTPQLHWGSPKASMIFWTSLRTLEPDLGMYQSPCNSSYSLKTTRKTGITVEFQPHCYVLPFSLYTACLSYLPLMYMLALLLRTTLYCSICF